MECYEALFSAVFNILSLYVNIRVIKLFLHPRHMNAAIKCFIYALVWFINWYVYYMFHILDLTTTSLFFGLLFIAYFLFEGGRIKKNNGCSGINCFGNRCRKCSMACIWTRKSLCGE